MQETASNRNRIIITSVAVLIAVAIIGLSVMAANNQQTAADTQTQPETAVQSNTTPATSTPDPITTPVAAPSTPPPATSGFKDGTYHATGTYSSPGSTHERITITVTLKDGVITDTSAISGAQEQEGREYQAQFIGGYKQLVVGKSIDTVSLSRVSGSSLTSRGFNDAINQIEQQAKA